VTLDLPIGRSPVVGLTTRRTVETFIFAPFLLYLLPVIGPFLAYTVGIAVLLIETYLGFYDPDGQRAGDTFAETLVVEYRQGSDGVPLSDRRA